MLDAALTDAETFASPAHDLLGRAARRTRRVAGRPPLHHASRVAARPPHAGTAREGDRQPRVRGRWPFASSAGITAGIDLALHLIAGECGDTLAASVAEDMVVYLRRSQRAIRSVPPPRASQRILHAAVHRVQDAIGAEPDRDGTWRRWRPSAT
jgi:hypothetical protein